MMLRENTRLFFQLTNTNEDINKHKQYHTQARRNKEKGRYNNLSDYLASLGLILKITIDNKKHISRLSQLTMKTNQFNITTKSMTS